MVEVWPSNMLTPDWLGWLPYKRWLGPTLTNHCLLSISISKMATSKSPPKLVLNWLIVVGAGSKPLQWVTSLLLGPVIVQSKYVQLQALMKKKRGFSPESKLKQHTIFRRKQPWLFIVVVNVKLVLSASSDLWRNCNIWHLFLGTGGGGYGHTC